MFVGSRGVSRFRRVVELEPGLDGGRRGSHERDITEARIGVYFSKGLVGMLFRSGDIHLLLHVSGLQH